MKRKLAATFWRVLACLLLLSGCTPKVPEPEYALVENVFSSMTQALPTGAQAIFGEIYLFPATEKDGERAGILCYEDYNPEFDYDTILYTIDLTDGSLASAILPKPRPEAKSRICGYAPVSDGRYYLIDVTTQDRRLYHIAESGEILASAVLPDGEIQDFIVKMTVDRDGNAVIGGDGVLWMYDSACQPIGSAAYSGMLEALTTDDQGRVVLQTMESLGSGKSYGILAERAVQDPIPIPHTPGTPGYEAYPAGAEYDMYLHNVHGLYGYRVSDDSQTEICSYINSDIYEGEMDTVRVLSPDRFVYQGTRDGHLVLSIATRVPEEDVIPKKLIRVQVDNLSDDMSRMAAKFNRQNDTWRVVFDDYSRYNTETDHFASMIQLDMDIAAGENLPDIFTLSDTFYAKYYDKGLFCDLYTLMDGDANFAKEDLMPCILTPLETNGKLYRLATRFTLKTMAVAANVYAEYAPWSLEHVLQYAEAQPKPIWEEYTRNELIRVFFQDGIGNFADQKACSFDDGRALRVLQLLERYGENDRIGLSEEEREEKNRTAPIRYQAGEILYTNGYTLYSIADYLDIYAMFEDTPFRCAGLPGREGGAHSILASRCYGIHAKSAVKDGAWEFLKFLLQAEEVSMYSGYPALKTKFEEQLDYEEQFLYYYSPTDVRRHVNVNGTNNRAYLEEQGVIFLEFTEEIRREFTDLAYAAASVNTVYPVVFEIVQDELSAFFGGGQSAQKAVENMQKRVELAIAERQ